MSDLITKLSLNDLERTLLPITVKPSSSKATFHNWARTYQCRPSRVFLPTNTSQLPYILELARRLGTTVRAAAAGHSPSDLACTSGFMIRTDHLNAIVEVNREKNYVVAEGGILLHKLHAVLAENGLAMSNVGSISDQSVAGIITTATHGTGYNFGVIPTHVLALDIMLPTPGYSVVRCSRTQNRDLFLASCCGLGATGFILNVTLQVEPAFRLKEYQQVIDFDDAVDHIEDIAVSSEHPKLWWFPSTGKMRCHSANRSLEPATMNNRSWFWEVFVGVHLVQLGLFLGRYIPSLVPWIGRMVLWLGGDHSVVIDDSWKIFNLDCRFSQYTTEWAIPFDRTKACLRDLRHWLDAEHQDPNGVRPHFPIEIRFSDADDIWLSPSNGRRSCWIGIVQFKPYGFPVPYQKLFKKFEDIMASHEGRPHWAKAHALTPEDLAQSYPDFGKFVDVLNQVDPDGLLSNPYVRRHIRGQPRNGEDIGPRIFKPLR